GPVEDGMHLETAVAHLERIELRAALGLAAAQPRKPGAGAQGLECTGHRFDLAQLEILVESFAALLPELAVLPLEVGHRLRAGETLDVERELLRELFDELVGLREQIAGVDEDHRDTR